MTNQPMSTRKVFSIVMVLVLMSIGALLYFSKKDTKKQMPVAPVVVKEPLFVNEGSLNFQYAEGDLLSTISVEIANNDSARAQGLMHRHSMADSLGMLFIYSRSQPQSFWMKIPIFRWTSFF